jgi:tetratricopeptide (TPR) repeat protein
MEGTILPEQLAERAKKEYQAGDYLAAAESFNLAAEAYGAAGDNLPAAEMKNNRGVSLLRCKQFELAKEAIWGTDEIFAQQGDLERQGTALANLASACVALKQYPEAVDHLESAGQILLKAGQIKKRLQVMQMLSTLQLRRFRVMDAVTSLQSGLAEVKEPTLKQRIMKMLLFIRL